MCGIVGYIGKNQAAPILLESLSKLEYRGYDSAGIAVRDFSNNLNIAKAKGKLVNLREQTNDGKALEGACGIGHTRWATHGEPSNINAHPHVSGSFTGEAKSDAIVGVHNGIIENYIELKKKLIKKGYTFYSDTDTEVVIKLVDYYYNKYDHDPQNAIAKTMVRVRGSYALELMFKDYPGVIWVARKDSPMIIGIHNGESYIASDVPAILKYTRDVYYIGNMEMAMVEAGNIVFYNLDGDKIQKELTEIKWDVASAEKDGYPHFMLKEIYEQPKAVRNTLNSLIKNNRINLESVGLSEELIKNCREIIIVGCGSAWHVGMVGQFVIENLAKIPVRCELASEFRYRNPLLSKEQLVIVISQSGETADSLAALRLAKESGVTTLAIVNVVGSSIAREADHVLYTLAGPEIAVATTKAYSAQLIAIYCLAIKFAAIRNQIDEKPYITTLQSIPNKIEEVLSNKSDIQRYAAMYSNSKDVFFIGRGIDYALCLEGSLKLKEVSYIHSEAYAAGELKHGTISLIEEGTLVIGSLSQKNVVEKTLSNMVECKARGASLLGLTSLSKKGLMGSLDNVIQIPQIDPLFAASILVVPLQLLAYYVSVAKGLDVDKPRNLAKSVTVE